MSQQKSLRKFRIMPRRTQYSNRFSYEELLNAESAIGKTLFGPIPEGHRREFFEHKKNVWIWYESWINSSGTLQEMTVRYEVRPTGVFKKVTGENYTKIKGDELNNFRLAANSYLKLIKNRLYS